MSNDLAQATIFYSWESDLHAKTTRNLIEGCLNKAIQQLGREDELDVDPSLDRDTRGVSGSARSRACCTWRPTSRKRSSSTNAHGVDVTLSIWRVCSQSPRSSIGRNSGECGVN